MARVSKKVSAAQRAAENAPHRIWKTAIYARLSDFDDVLRNTESLEVQISYIKEYITRSRASSQGRAKKVVQAAQKEQSEHLQRQNLLQKVRRKIGLSLAK